MSTPKTAATGMMIVVDIFPPVLSPELAGDEPSGISTICLLRIVGEGDPSVRRHNDEAIRRKGIYML